MTQTIRSTTRRAAPIGLALAVALATMLALPGTASADSHAATVEVGGDGNVFTPDSTEVEVGDTVLFEWAGGNHDVTFEDDSIDSSETTSEEGFTFTATFDEAGTFAYTCTVHGGMDGEIVVVDAADDTADATDDATDDAAEDEADVEETEQPTDVDAGSGGALGTLPALVLAMMALGAVAVATPVLVGRRR
jgi:plastocyanin